MSAAADRFDFTKDYLADGETAAKVIVEANAGTGKTYSIENLYCQLLTGHEKKLPVEKVLVVTFTDAATAELKKRLRDGLVKASELAVDDEVRRAAKKALASFDLAPIFTIHGFCKRALEDFAFESGADLDAELGADDTALLAESVRDYYNREIESGGEPGNFAELLDFAKEVFRIPKAELVPDIRSFDDDCAMEKGEALASAVMGAKLPVRDSGFKRVLARLQGRLADGGTITAEDIIAEPELFGTTAAKNAPELAEAMKAYEDAKAILQKKRLLAHLEDAKKGFLARKARSNKMSFDDLLKRMDDALSGNGAEAFANALRKAYDVAIVDEFQDTDPLQYNIFNSVFGGGNGGGAKKLFFMMGDPKQAIYSFRSGDLATYRKAYDSVAKEGGERKGLYENYRSCASVIDTVNNLFAEEYSAERSAFLEDGIRYTGSECGCRDEPEKLKSRLKRGDAPLDRPFRLLWLKGQTDDDGNLASVAQSKAGDAFFQRAACEIAKMLNDETYRISREGGAWQRLRPKDFAVLVEQNWQCREMRDELKQRGVPAVIMKSGNVFASQDAKDIAFILEAMLNPGRSKRVKAALLTAWCGRSPFEVANIDDKSIEADIARFAELGDVWRKSGVAAAMSGFLEKFNGLYNIAKAPDCERRMVNERHIVELLHKREQEGSLEPEGTLKFLHDSLAEAENGGEQGPEEYEERLESDEDAVAIMTVFKSKGLEFPIVFCPTVSTGYHPVEEKKMKRAHKTDADGTRIVFPVGAEAKREYYPGARSESFGEKIRLLYVALTRASCACVILGGNVLHKTSGYATAFHYLLLRRSEPNRRDGEAKGTVPEMGPPSIESIRDVVAIEEDLLSDYCKDADAPVRYVPAMDAHRDEGGVRRALEAPAVKNEFAVMSYSGMVEHSLEAVGGASAKKDEAITPDDCGRENELKSDPLPRSAATGRAVHKVFELVDYRDGTNWNKAIEKALRDNGLSDEEGATARRDAVRALVEQTLCAKLPGCGFSLDSVATGDTKREWTFFSAVNRKPVLAPFKKAGLAFKPGADGKSGCITGEIDLIFRADGKYYFADWKTDRLADYSPKTLEREMAKRGYLFQAVVYAMALRDLLKRRLGAKFDFSKHFGGGFYCFVRGVKDGDGIHRFNPSSEELDRYQACFGRNV